MPRPLRTNGETLACGLLGESLVKVAIDFLKASRIKSVGKNGCPTDDVSTGFQFFHIAFHHFRLDAVPQGFGLGLGFLNDDLH